MAADSQAHALTNGSPPQTPTQLSLPLPNAPGSRIHLHLTLLATSLVLFLSSSSSDSAAGAPASMGSFVFAMPDVRIASLVPPTKSFQTKESNLIHLSVKQRYNPTQPLSTPLYTLPSSLDFATRLAKVLARKTGKGAYVGSSVSFADSGMGGTVEEEMEGFRRVVETVVGVVKKDRRGGES